MSEFVWLWSDPKNYSWKSRGGTFPSAPQLATPVPPKYFWRLSLASMNDKANVRRSMVSTRSLWQCIRISVFKLVWVIVALMLLWSMHCRESTFSCSRGDWKVGYSRSAEVCWLRALMSIYFSCRWLTIVSSMSFFKHIPACRNFITLFHLKIDISSTKKDK